MSVSRICWNIEYPLDRAYIRNYIGRLVVTTKGKHWQCATLRCLNNFILPVHTRYFRCTTPGAIAEYPGR